MLRFITLTMALITAPSLAHAGPMPAYDPEVICSDLAGTSAKQELVMLGCLDFQDRIRKEIGFAWDQLPVTVQDSCGKAAAASGDYWRLKSCIDKEAPTASVGTP
jgi:hypothetical protein